jgi:methyltransferase (TIGR00027 family)
VGASFTAQVMALQRAFETAQPPSRRLFDDPLAPRFLSAPLRLAAELARLPVVGPVVPAVYDRIWPGPRPSAVARTRLIDDTVRTAVEGGARQLVVLGAGFDSRAWRLPELAGARVVEVDRPDTQAAKRAALGRAGQPLGPVTLLAVDFEHDDLVAAVRGTAFAADQPSLFVWEGVTNYLSPTAVDRTLADVRALSCPGSQLVFTYVHRGVIDGSVHFPEAKRWMGGVAGVGEPWTFGLLPETLGGYLAERGFELVWEVSTAEAGRRYFEPRGRPDRGSDLYRVALARVPCPG